MLDKVLSLIGVDAEQVLSYINNSKFIQYLKMVDMLAKHNEQFGRCILKPEFIPEFYEGRAKLFARLLVMYQKGYLKLYQDAENGSYSLVMSPELSDSIVYRVSPAGQPFLYFPKELKEIVNNEFYYFRTADDSVRLGNISIYENLEQLFYIYFALAPNKIDAVNRDGSVGLGLYSDPADPSTYRMVQQDKVVSYSDPCYSGGGFAFQDNPTTASGRKYRALADMGIVLSEDPSDDLDKLDVQFKTSEQTLAEIVTLLSIIYSTSQKEALNLVVKILPLDEVTKKKLTQT